MDDQERADGIYDLQQLAREREQIMRDRDRLEKAWDDVVIATMELEFLGEPE